MSADLFYKTTPEQFNKLVNSLSPEQMNVLKNAENALMPKAVAAKQKSVGKYSILAGLFVGFIFFMLQIVGVGMLADQLRKPVLKDYVVAPAAAVRFAMTGERASSDDKSTVTVPDGTVPPQVVIDRFQVACFTFNKTYRRAVQVAIGCGIIQVILNLVVNMSYILANKSSTGLRFYHLLLMLIDLLFLFSIINLATALNNSVKDAVSTDTTCLRVQDNLLLPYLRFSIGMWLFYIILNMVVVYPAFAYNQSARL